MCSISLAQAHLIRSISQGILEPTYSISVEVLKARSLSAEGPMPTCSPLEKALVPERLFSPVGPMPMSLRLVLAQRI